MRTLICICMLPLCLCLGCGDSEPRQSEVHSVDVPETDRSNTWQDKNYTELANLATGQMGQFEYDDAVQSYEKLRELRPDSDTYQVDLAIALLNRRLEGDLDRSAKLLDAVMESSPENLRAKYCRALLFFNEGDANDARQLFQSVAEEDPSDSYAVYYVAQTRLIEGEFAEALEGFMRAAEIDPYLRSSYYGAFQAAQRMKDMKQARIFLKSFQRLENNPRARLAELKYTRMGPKAAVSDPAGEPSVIASPGGPLFTEPRELAIENVASVNWNLADNKPKSITIADINSDGKSDLFVAGAATTKEGAIGNLVLLRSGEGYRPDISSPLGNVENVNTALWGDFDDDGLTDVYLCRDGENQLWRQCSAGEWEDVTETTQTGGGDVDTVDGACYDADHDGDLDYFLVNSNAPCELLSNNRDGTFRPLASEMGLAAEGRGSKLLLVADLDSDDDADVLFFNQDQPHDVLLNDRLWKYHPATGFEELTNTPVSAAVAHDTDVDGQVELFTFGSGKLLVWRPNDNRQWTSQVVAMVASNADATVSLAIQDFDGDTASEIALQVGPEILILELDGKEQARLNHKQLVGSINIRTGLSGPTIIGASLAGPPLLWNAGSGRHGFTLLSLSGRTDKAAEMRSNASGIGVRGAARIGSRWSSISPWRTNSGPGQNLQPVAIGMAGANKIDFVRLVWPDGVSQSELSLESGQHHKLAETQRQAGSCPLVFVWNGECYEFVADILGAGGIGFNLGKGEYYQPRPSESLLIRGERIVPKDGRIAIKLGEPMEEICYFDAVRLVEYQVPPQWEMALDERFGGTDPQPTGKPFWFRKELLPEYVENDRQQDVTSTVVTSDRVAAPLDPSDRRFVGHTNPYTLTLRFAEPLEILANPVLLFDGWVEYAYSQTAFAAWQAGITYQEPIVEAKGADGRWHQLLDRFGYMAGTSRRASVKLPCEKIPEGAAEIRISSNMQIYWDRISIVDAVAEVEFVRHELALQHARVADVGFSSRRLFEQRFTIYDYADRPPMGDARHPRGFYTALGEATELVERTDNALAIIGPGEELHLEFSSAASELQTDWRRYYVLEADGWCKDSDSFTQYSRTVDPLPTRGTYLTEHEEAHRQKLHSEYNTRYRSGW